MCLHTFDNRTMMVVKAIDDDRPCKYLVTVDLTHPQIERMLDKALRSAASRSVEASGALVVWVLPPEANA